MAKSLIIGNPRKLIFFYMLPLLLGNMFQQVYNIADTFIVGRTLDPGSLAAVGSVSTLMFLVLGFAQATTAGLTIPMAQRFGAENYSGVRRSFAVSILVSAVIAIGIIFVGAVFADNLLVAMQTPSDIFDDAKQYLFYIFLGCFFTIAYNLLANVLRALGDSRTPLYFLVIAAIFNIVLDLVFIICLGTGVSGATIATVLSQGISVLCCIVYIMKKVPALHLSSHDFRLNWQEVYEHVRLGIPMGLQASIIAIGSLTIQVALNQHGSSTVAAYTAAQRIEQLAMFPFVSFGITIGVFAAQNYGAGFHNRIWQGGPPNRFDVFRLCSSHRYSGGVGFALVGWSILRGRRYC